MNCFIHIYLLFLKSVKGERLGKQCSCHRQVFHDWFRMTCRMSVCRLVVVEERSVKGSFQVCLILWQERFEQRLSYEIWEVKYTTTEVWDNRFDLLSTDGSVTSRFCPTFIVVVITGAHEYFMTLIVYVFGLFVKTLSKQPESVTCLGSVSKASRSSANHWKFREIGIWWLLNALYILYDQFYKLNS